LSATALQIINRIRRKLKWEDVSSFSATDSLTNALIDLANESKRDVLEGYEWDFDIRSDGIFKTVAAHSYSGTGLVANASTSVFAGTGNQYTNYDGGDLRARLIVTSDPDYGSTPFIVSSSSLSAGKDLYVIETGFPGTTDITSASVDVMVSEYVLPTTVRDVLSVMVEDSDTSVEFVDKVDTLDRVIPNAFSETSSIPDVCFVGGSTTPTMDGVTDGTPALGIWMYPVPSTVYMVRYTYRYRHPSLSAITDTLQVPDHVIDHIVDLAVVGAKNHRTAIDLEGARQLEIVTREKLRRTVKRTGSQPLESFSLRSHDRKGGVSMGSRPSNPNIFYQP